MKGCKNKITENNDKDNDNNDNSYHEYYTVFHKKYFTVHYYCNPPRHNKLMSTSIGERESNRPIARKTFTINDLTNVQDGS